MRKENENIVFRILPEKDTSPPVQVEFWLELHDSASGPPEVVMHARRVGEACEYYIVGVSQRRGLVRGQGVPESLGLPIDPNVGDVVRYH